MWFGDKDFTREKVLEILKTELEARKTRSQYYSIRAFARDLEVDQSLLAKVLREEKPVSWDIAKQVQLKILKAKSKK